MWRAFAASLIALGLGTTSALGQATGAEPSSLGTAPGSGARVGGPVGGQNLGGGLGPAGPRVPANMARPGGLTIPPAPPLGGVTEPPPLELPAYGSLALPPGAEDEGPADGLTLDAAIERLVHHNVELRGKFLEIPQAEADVLTASLRGNPVLFADTQLIPYGAYSDARPGGPVQYDVNITLPLDLNHKRRLRTDVACRARLVIEAQYQDAVRLQIDRLATAFVDVLAARETVQFARTSLEGLGKVEATTRDLFERGEKTEAELARVTIQRQATEIGLADAEEALRASTRSLARLLDLPPAAGESLALRGGLSDRAPPPPPVDDLLRIALTARPDLAAYRLGLQRAGADVRLAEAERFADVYLMAQPYTFQDLSPFGKKSAHAWGLGLTVPLPVFNRNQGNIQRARVNVVQTQTELHDLERQVAADVVQAEREYAVTRAAVARIEAGLLPTARKVLDEALTRYRQGETALVDYLQAQREHNDVVRQYRDTVLRHRRSMLALNTAVGQRVLP